MAHSDDQKTSLHGPAADCIQQLVVQASRRKIDAADNCDQKEAPPHQENWTSLPTLTINFASGDLPEGTPRARSEKRQAKPNQRRRRNAANVDIEKGAMASQGWTIGG
jgi:hypothetical protein